MRHKRVAVLRGGPSLEYDISIKTGLHVLAALDELGYSTKDIVITKGGEWLHQGIAYSPDKALQGIDIVFIALHGKYGEDGTLQRLLQHHQLPFTGSGHLASAIAFNKPSAKEMLLAEGIKTPRHMLVTLADFSNIRGKSESIVETLGNHVFIKPTHGGSSIDTYMVDSIDAIESALRTVLERHGRVLVEEKISGREGTVGVLENFRDKSHYSLPVVEVTLPDDASHFTFEHKYNNQATRHCPSRFTTAVKKELERQAIQAHKVLNCRQYSRSNFIVKGDEIYFLELNTLPGMSTASHLPTAAQSIGIEYNDLVDHLVQTARI